MSRQPRKLTMAELRGMDDDELLLPREVAALLRVHPQTVGRWGLPVVRTPGGHARYRVGDVRRHLRGDSHGRERG